MCFAFGFADALTRRRARRDCGSRVFSRRGEQAADFAHEIAQVKRF